MIVANWPPVSSYHDRNASRTTIKRYVARRDGYRCHYCNARLIEKKDRTLDHVIPKSMKGPNAAWNLVLCCYRCNEQKRDLPYETFTGKKRLPSYCRFRTTQAFLDYRAGHDYVLVSVRDHRHNTSASMLQWQTR